MKSNRLELTLFRLFTGLLAAGLLAACDNGAGDNKDGKAGADASLQTAAVLATVNGEPITDEDVYGAIDRTFSELDKLAINEEVYDKVLQSLIASRAIAQTMKAQMSEDEIAELNRKVAAYEEELYVKAYLSAHAVPEPVTVQMVEAYYQNNPDKFGAKTIKEFEQLTAARRLTEAERDRLLADAAEITTARDWNELAQTSISEYPLSYKRAYAAEGLLTAEYDKVIKGLSPGDPAQLFIVDGSPVMLRVIGEKVTPARPLHEVSAEIRKTLAPLQMRKAVKAVSDAAVANAVVSRQE